MNSVRKAVVPSAGLGTRFLPVTRSVPKVLLPVLDTPLVHYAAAEAANAGIEEVIFVLSPSQEPVSAYFERRVELEEALRDRGHAAVAERMERISQMARISYVYQEKQLGLGHAVLAARDAIGEEPFAVILPDDLIWSDRPTIASMIEIFQKHGSSVVAVKEVPDTAVPSLGIVGHDPVDERLSRVMSMVEKPSLEEAPSNLAIVGRYVLTPQVIEALTEVRAGALGEIQLTDAIASLLTSQEVFAYRFPGTHMDVGVPLGLLKASIYMALQTEGMASELKDWLGTVLPATLDD